ncbi:hypothetical protein [Helicobacter cinaedi]|uniref:hypothetical protein n=1 Tax=Helicobacter cinaedi TaxID=213 RepID=UPI0002D60949|nr:hypothetical protein [Helicobacter cinaedi]
MRADCSITLLYLSFVAQKGDENIKNFTFFIRILESAMKLGCVKGSFMKFFLECRSFLTRIGG